MLVSALVSALVIALLAAVAPSAAWAWTQPSGVACSGAEDCRQKTLDALERGEVEAAHDLAWRAMQTGSARDPDLMFLLARAQSASGRAGDALVMLRRLAESGVARDVSSDEAFDRVRNLPGWPDVEALIARVRSGAAGTPAPAAAPAPGGRTGRSSRDVAPNGGPETSAPASVASSRSAETSGVAAVGDTVRFSADRFAAGGLAYDTVSRRFLFGDHDGRKLRVVGEGLDHAVDLVRSPSAGFFSVTAVEIDARRGDLWVASADAGDGKSAVHKLQLVSGRHLKTYPIEIAQTPALPVDLAVTAGGVVIAVDGRGGRVLRLRPGRASVETVTTLKDAEPTSVTLGRSDDVVYVAYRTGISLVDLKGGKRTVLTAAKGISLEGFERLRLHKRALVGVQVDGDGVRRIVRMTLDNTGRSVRSVRVVEPDAAVSTGPTFVTIVGDDLWFVADDFRAAELETPVELVVRRVRLP